MSDIPLDTTLTGRLGGLEQRLAFIIETMREMSRHTDPQVMVQNYGKRMRQILPSDGSVSLSRRDLHVPRYRITRSSRWKTPINPWKSKQQLPLLEGGLFAELIYGDMPVILDELLPDPNDPAAEYLQGVGSLVAIPLYDRGVALNMVVLFRKERGAFRREQLPEHVWMSNLFGRATQNLVLSDQLREAYDVVDRELQVVAEIQRSLLPVTLPKIPTLELAAFYETSRRAGGDYYDFFPLPDGRWGILIADVSGHGTPAAVLMAVTHSIAHTHFGPPSSPSGLMTFINRHLAARYTNGSGNFVTAFYGIYDPRERTLSYCSAGHPSPRLRRDGSVTSIREANSLPLGIESEESYFDCLIQFQPGDAILFYTDGITEARSVSDDLFGMERLDETLNSCTGDAAEIVACTLFAVEDFDGGYPPTDDRTLLAARVVG